MGNTTRRESISFNIPSAPNYKYQNIVDFKGLAITSNPFNAEYNTASDLLNVYVDEENALTTRPRLEKIRNLIPEMPENSEVIKIIDIDNIYLVLMKTLDEYSFKWVLPTGLVDIECDDVPTDIYNKFKQNDKVYVLTDKGIYVVDEYEVNKIEPVIPHRYAGVGKVVDTKNVITELNALTDKYYVDYTWDGTWDLNEIGVPVDASQVKTMNVKKLTDDFRPDTYSVLNPIRYLPNNVDLTSNGRQPALLVISTQESQTPGVMITYLRTRTFDVNNPTVAGEWSAPIDSINGFMYADITGTGEIYTAYKGSVADTATDRRVIVANRRTGDLQTILPRAQNINLNRMYNRPPLRINRLGTVICFITNTKGEIRRYASYTDYSTPDISTNVSGTFDGVDMSDDGRVAVFYGTESLTSHKVTNLVFYDTLNSTTLNNFNIPSGEIFQSLAISPNGTNVAIKTDKFVRYFTNFLTLPTNYTTILDTQVGLDFKMSFSESGDKLYVYGNYIQGWLMTKSLNFVYNTFVDTTNMLFDSSANGVYHTDYFTDDTTVVFGYDDTDRFKDKGLVNVTQYKFGSPDSTFSVERTIDENDPYYNTWLKANAMMQDLRLYKRFYNKHYFASTNSIIFTDIADCSYFGIDNWSTIGNTNSTEEITGLNLIADGILGVFKNNGLWYYTEQTTEDGTTIPYIQESKLNMGNNTFNGAITTQYSNQPLIINYNGIYNTRQMENVNITDSLALSISDNIAAKWITENRDEIDNATVFNIKYWTAIALKGNITKMYLLDGRNGSWYYWELPIASTLIYSDEEYVYIVDVNMNEYRLVKHDIITDYGTEYYDDVNEPTIITWRWVSQILPLGTINYSKKLVNTTFILTDTDDNDEYGLNYRFTSYRKSANTTTQKTLTSSLNFVQSTTKKTLLQRFNFLKFEISNITADDTNIVDNARNNNKFRLVGIGLKYLLLEGM